MKMKVIGLCMFCVFFCSACTNNENVQNSSSQQLVSTSSSQAPSASASTGSSMQNLAAEPLVYRGEITALSDEGITVSQLPGYNYGQESIVFLLEEQSEELALGMYVQVQYDGVLTRSIPPQATALSAEVLAPMADGVLWGGSILTSEETEDGYRLELQAEIPRQELVILNVPFLALEGLDASDLVEGTKVLAITNGAMTASLPPQVSAIVLLPLEE